MSESMQSFVRDGSLSQPLMALCRPRAATTVVAMAMAMASAAASAAAAADITVAVDWPVFLSRHDLMWDWVWGSTAASTLSPRNEHLHMCGAGGTAGQCCLEAAPPSPSQLGVERPSESFGGFIQLALAHQKPSWGCALSAVPPKLCCLPVPGGLMSGCHQREEKRWAYNQFFSLETQAAAAAAGPGQAGSATFRLRDKATRSCYTLKSGAKVPALANCTGQLDGGRAPNLEQAWTVVVAAAGTFLLKNVGSGTCVTALGAHEASAVTMGSCSASAAGANSWQPVCDGSAASPLAGWPCLNGTNVPPPLPPPGPPPPPPPPVHGDAVRLATCDGSKESQQWHIDAQGHVKVGDGSRCLAEGGVVAPCASNAQAWGPPTPIDGFFQMSKGQLSSRSIQVAGAGAGTAGGNTRGRGSCLQINTPKDFCGGGTSVCPVVDLQNFELGMNLTTANCNDGNQAQLFAATYKATDGSTKENLMPLFWATAAYVGNGVLGLRVQAEAEADGVFQLLLDNNNAGRGGHRMETGYYRLHTNAPPTAIPLHVSIRQRLYNGLLEANVTDAHGAVVCSFSAFVNAADTDAPVAVIDVHGSTLAKPSLEWVDRKGNTAYGNKTVTSAAEHRTTVFVGVLASDHKGTAAAASAIATAAATAGRAKLLAVSTGWWADFWPQSFVTLPTTRLEGFYYTQMYRFVSSDRVGLHGLMGAFGPTGNYNFWGDDVSSGLA
eukprot:SAG22_NODE_324_length_12373_cov_23.912254_5_plen_721_part_00